VTIIGLFELNDNIPAFKNHLRDFLVEIKVIIVLLITVFKMSCLLKGTRW